MQMPDELVREKVYGGWASFLESLQESVATLEKEIEFASKMVNACTMEWCEATERAIDEISNSLFSISEPSWLPEEDSRKLKQLKRKVHDIYAQYKAASVKR